MPGSGVQEGLKKIYSMPMKTVYLLKLELQLQRHTSGLLEAMEEHSDNADQETPVLCSLLASRDISCSFLEKSLSSHLEVLFWQLLQGDISKSPGLGASRPQYGDPQDCVDLHTLKAAT